MKQLKHREALIGTLWVTFFPFYTPKIYNISRSTKKLKERKKNGEGASPSCDQISVLSINSEPGLRGCSEAAFGVLPCWKLPSIRFTLS